MNENISVVMLSVCLLCVNAFGENREAPWTPRQLLEKSDLAFTGSVTKIETTADKFKKTFPVAAKVVSILKGKLDSDVLAFGHKHPGLSAIFEEEFNTPKVGQQGTFYLVKEPDNSYTLIGYIRTTDRDRDAPCGAPLPHH